MRLTQYFIDVLMAKNTSGVFFESIIKMFSWFQEAKCVVKGRVLEGEV